MAALGNIGVLVGLVRGGAVPGTVAPAGVNLNGSFGLVGKGTYTVPNVPPQPSPAKVQTVYTDGLFSAE